MFWSFDQQSHRDFDVGAVCFDTWMWKENGTLGGRNGWISGISPHRCFNNTRVCMWTRCRRTACCEYLSYFLDKSPPCLSFAFRASRSGASRTLLLNPGWSAASICSLGWSYRTNFHGNRDTRHPSIDGVRSIIDKSAAVRRLREIYEHSISIQFNSVLRIERWWKSALKITPTLRNVWKINGRHT